jgi:hypothetical protein
MASPTGTRRPTLEPSATGRSPIGTGAFGIPGVDEVRRVSESCSRCTSNWGGDRLGKLPLRFH